ncbi:MAG TPA: CPBP family intramembrane glutamic endopeptidase [Candidatus Acidoferrum sp.]|nr:CPBP family intramembrane glutamic endopeptidase [Candidatus Acidoferrum sp.]
MPATRQLGAPPLVALALLLTIVLAFLASTGGRGYWYAERAFLATLVVFAGFLSIMLLFAARGIAERFSALAGSGGSWLLTLLQFVLFLVYALGTGTASLERIAAALAFFFAPLLVLSSTQGAAPGSWQDFVTIGAIWTAVKFGPSHWLWPYPGGRLAYIFTVITAVNVAIAGFLLSRRIKNVGYNIGWGSGWTLYIFGALAVFAVVAIPLGLQVHFIAYAPRFGEWKAFIPLSIGILFFTAWPEEFLFRGLLQNLLSRAGNSDTVAWVAASVLFGLSHITNLHFPNWKYVLLASIAGLFYGWTWRKTGSIFASALVHAGVDILWHFLFRTV